MDSLNATTKGAAPKAQRAAIDIQHLPEYLFWALLGMLGGAVGVALAIGLAIGVQLLLPPPAIFAPGVIPLIIAGTVAGLGISWLFGGIAGRLFPSMSRRADEHRLQVILFFSVLISLLQTLLLTRGS